MSLYRQRIADRLLLRKLSGKGAVLIDGPKWCGKTTTAKRIAASTLDLGDGSILSQSRQLLEIKPSSLLEGPTPRLIDEWQTLPPIWDSIRSEVDKRAAFSQFILTGSSVLPEADTTIHSGTGRFGRVHMRPMSLFESGDSNGLVSLASLFETNNIENPIECETTLNEVAFLCCRGGWPEATFLTGDIALDQAADYSDSVIDYDLPRIGPTRHSAERGRRLLKAYARNIAQSVSYATLKKDMQANDSGSIDEETIAEYIDAFKRLFVIEDMAAWNPNLRSKAAIRTGDTRYFVDPSIGTGTLGIGPKDLLGDLNTFGLYFENLAVRDLRVYADALDGKLYHYRDSSGLECDAVLHRRNGSYALIEVKLGGETSIDQGAASLLSLSGRIDVEKMREPSFMMVLTAVGRYAYQRRDGVMVVPIGCLKD